MSIRKVITRAWMEQMILEAEDSELTPLTRKDLESVRELIRRPLPQRCKAAEGSRTPKR